MEPTRPIGRPQYVESGFSRIDCYGAWTPASASARRHADAVAIYRPLVPTMVSEAKAYPILRETLQHAARSFLGAADEATARDMLVAGGVVKEEEASAYVAKWKARLKPAKK